MCKIFTHRIKYYARITLLTTTKITPQAGPDIYISHMYLHVWFSVFHMMNI